jgi:hypothetical protein
MIDCRDLAIVPDPSGCGWLGYVVMRRKASDAYSSACIGLWRSSDLLHWISEGPCFAPDRFACVEVPDVFRIGETWYMIGLTGDGYGQAYRWEDYSIRQGIIVAKSHRAEGPYEEVKDNLLLAANDGHVSAARTVEVERERLVLWIRTSPDRRVSRPARIVENRSGGLSAAYWPGCGRAYSEELRSPEVRLRGHGSWVLKRLEGLPEKDESFMVTASVSLEKPGTAAIVFRHKGESLDAPAYIAVIDTAAGGVAFGKTTAVSAIQRRRWGPPISGSFQVRLIVAGGFFELYIDDVLELQGGDAEIPQGGVSVGARTGAVRFSDIRYLSGR